MLYPLSYEGLAGRLYRSDRRGTTGNILSGGPDHEP